MSDFKIIKCTKCDAALVELQGQKLNKCIQCGKRFTLAKSHSHKRTTVVSKTAIKPEARNQNTKTKAPLKRNKGTVSVIASLIKWYIFISIIIVIFRVIF